MFHKCNPFCRDLRKSEEARFLSMKSCCQLKRDLAAQWEHIFRALLLSLQPISAQPGIKEMVDFPGRNIASIVQGVGSEDPIYEQHNPFVLACSYKRHESIENFDCAGNFSFVFSNDGISVGFNILASYQQFGLDSFQTLRKLEELQSSIDQRWCALLHFILLSNEHQSCRDPSIQRMSFILGLSESRQKHDGGNVFYARSGEDAFHLGIQESEQFPDAIEETMRLEAGTIHTIQVLHPQLDEMNNFG